MRYGLKELTLEQRIMGDALNTRVQDVGRRAPSGGKGIASKLALLRRHTGPIEKDGLDRHLGRRYITTDAMMGAVRDAANAVGLATTCRQRVLEWGVKENGTFYTLVEVAIVFLDPDTGEHEEMVGIGAGEDKGARVMNIAVTYATKNALKAGLLIGDEAEADATDAGGARAAGGGAARGPGRGGGLSPAQVQALRGALAGVAGAHVRALLEEFNAASPADIAAERFEEARAKAERLPRDARRRVS
jgi:hypothetical protein